METIRSLPNVGEHASITKKATHEVVLAIADFSGDTNPIHLSEEYAQNTVFRHRIAHGLFCEGLISAVLATKLPGEGTVLLRQSFAFRKPVYLDDTVTANVTVTGADPASRKVSLELLCTNQKGETVLTGTTDVKVM